MGIIIKDGITYGDQPDISGKVDKVEGKQLSTNDYTDSEKEKLASNMRTIVFDKADADDISEKLESLEVNETAMFYTTDETVSKVLFSSLDSNYLATIISGIITRNISLCYFWGYAGSGYVHPGTYISVYYKDAAGWAISSNKTSYFWCRTANSSRDGYMSSTDKTKLDAIEAGAQVNTITGVKGDSESEYRTGDVNITKANIGLSNVDNTSDTDKPISTATQTALDNKISTSLKGAASGVAELDENGKVPTSQLPSFVDDVVEYSSLSNFPLEGETGKIYVDTLDNKTYRWSGSSYVEISPSLALGETSATAYRGDRGKTAYDHASAKGAAFSNGLYKITTNSEGHVTGATAVTKSDITALGIPESDTNIITGVKGNAESTYRTGNVNLTPENIGALKISGGDVTGNILRKLSDVDASKEDNGVTETIYPSTFSVVDKNNNPLRILSRLESIIYPNGNIGSYWYLKNYNTSGDAMGQKGIRMTMTKAGDITYVVDDPNKFRAAIGLEKVNNEYDSDKYVKGVIDNRDSQTFTTTDLTFTNPVELPDGEGWSYSNPRNSASYPCICLSNRDGTSIGAFDFEDILATLSKAGFMSATDKAKLKNADAFTNIRLLYSTDNLNNVHGTGASGIYYVGAGVTNSPQDYCGMLVISREGDTGFCAQLAIGHAGIYYRVYVGNPITWTSWYKVTGTAI